MEMRQTSPALARGAEPSSPAHLERRLQKNVPGVAHPFQSPLPFHPALQAQHPVLVALEVRIDADRSVAMSEIESPTIASPFDFESIDLSIGDGEDRKTRPASSGKIDPGVKVIRSVLAEGGDETGHGIQGRPVSRRRRRSGRSRRGREEKQEAEGGGAGHAADSRAWASRAARPTGAPRPRDGNNPLLP